MNENNIHKFSRGRFNSNADLTDPQFVQQVLRDIDKRKREYEAMWEEIDNEDKDSPVETPLWSKISSKNKISKELRELERLELEVRGLLVKKLTIATNDNVDDNWEQGIGSISAIPKKERENLLKLLEKKQKLLNSGENVD